MFDLNRVHPLELRQGSSPDRSRALRETFDREFALCARLESAGQCGARAGRVDWRQRRSQCRRESGVLSADAFIRFSLGFTIDLSNLLESEALLSWTTRASASELFWLAKISRFGSLHRLGQSQLTALPPQSLTAKPSLSLIARLGLKKEIGGDGRYLATEVNSTLLDASVRATLAIDLPVFFPTPAFPISSATKDLNGDGFPDHVLHIGTSFGTDGKFKGIQVVTPDFNAGTALFAVINNPGTLLASLEGMFDLKSKLAGFFDTLGLPMVGDAVKDASGFLDGLRDDLLGTKSATTHLYTDGLGYTLQQGALSGKTTIQLIQEALYDKLGPGNDGHGPNLLKGAAG